MVDGLLRAFLTLVETLLGLWPDVDDLGVNGDAPLVVKFLAGAQGVADVASVLEFVTGLLLVFPAMFAVKAALWLWQLLPGKAS
jgi:hypothetical protein